MVTNNKQQTTNNRVNLVQVRSWTVNRADFCNDSLTRQKRWTRALCFEARLVELKTFEKSLRAIMINKKLPCLIGD